MAGHHGPGHGRGGLSLHHPGRSPVHRWPAHLKIAGLLVFVLLVVATPRGWVAAFAAHLAVLVGVAVLARVPAGHLLRRLVVEVPFVAFALLLPFVAHGPRTEVLGIAVSQDGLLAAWGLLAKGTLGVLASLLLAATTTPHELLAGLGRLRLPHPLVAVLASMVRYLDLVADELRRMRIALESRGLDSRDPRQWPALARTLGALFIRSYERGERVHLAMLARGWNGRPPR